jgi:hypothetical protein
MLTGNDLLTKIEELRAEHPAITNTELVLQCGFVKENGKAAYVEFYTELLAAKGVVVDTDDADVSDENQELYDQLCESHSQGAVDAFIKLYDEDSLSDFEDAYMGEYSSEAAFAEQYAEMHGEQIPSWIVVDWEATWNYSLRYDFDEQDGYFFRSC